MKRIVYAVITVVVLFGFGSPLVIFSISDLDIPSGMSYAGSLDYTETRNIQGAEIKGITKRLDSIASSVGVMFAKTIPSKNSFYTERTLFVGGHSKSVFKTGSQTRTFAMTTNVQPFTGLHANSSGVLPGAYSFGGSERATKAFVRIAHGELGLLFSVKYTNPYVTAWKLFINSPMASLLWSILVVIAALSPATVSFTRDRVGYLALSGVSGCGIALTQVKRYLGPFCSIVFATSILIAVIVHSQTNALSFLMLEMFRLVISCLLFLLILAVLFATTLWMASIPVVKIVDQRYTLFIGTIGSWVVRVSMISICFSIIAAGAISLVTLKNDVSALSLWKMFGDAKALRISGEVSDKVLDASEPEYARMIRALNRANDVFLLQGAASNTEAVMEYDYRLDQGNVALINNATATSLGLTYKGHALPRVGKDRYMSTIPKSLID